MFPIITDLATFREAVAHKDEIKFNLQPNGSTVACYVVSMPGTFDSLEAKECRGIVFSTDGTVASRPLHKFHNVGEKEATRIENLDWSCVARVMDKRDGSMIHTVNVGFDKSPDMMAIEHGFIIETTFDIKSKKSFTSDVANSARAFMRGDSRYVSFCQAMTDAGITAIFEYTSPTARIVLYYPEEALTLLHLRNNMTGKYLPLNDMRQLAIKFEIPIIDEKPELLDVLKADPYKLAAETKDVEGWVIQFDDGEMVKLKTAWYLERHRAMTFLRERDIVKLVLSEGVDDLKSLLVGEGADITEIELIEIQVVTELNNLAANVEAGFAHVKNMSLKEAALLLKDTNPYFGLIMAKMRGKEPDLKEWFTKHSVDTYSLRQLNIMQSVAEVE